MADWDKTAQACGNCRHWLIAWIGNNDVPYGTHGPLRNGSRSECRRRAPTYERLPDRTATAHWPETGREDYCGEFEEYADA